MSGYLGLKVGAGIEGTFWGDEGYLNLTVGTLAQLYKFTEIHVFVHVKMRFYGMYIISQENLKKLFNVLRRKTYGDRFSSTYRN